jgi:hypothetical protein
MYRKKRRREERKLFAGGMSEKNQFSHDLWHTHTFNGHLNFEIIQIPRKPLILTHIKTEFNGSSSSIAKCKYYDPASDSSEQTSSHVVSSSSSGAHRNSFENKLF